MSNPVITLHSLEGFKCEPLPNGNVYIKFAHSVENQPEDCLHLHISYRDTQILAQRLLSVVGPEDIADLLGKRISGSVRSGEDVSGPRSAPS